LSGETSFVSLDNKSGGDRLGQRGDVSARPRPPMRTVKSSMTSEETAILLLARALGISESEIDRKTSIESSKAWDSLAHFRVVLALEEAIDRSLTPAEVFDLNGFESVVVILQIQ